MKQMEKRAIEERDLNACAELYSQTFSLAPWNEEWTTSSAIERLSHFYNSKGFCGVVAENVSAAGFIMGTIEPYYSGPIFYLREMCIGINQQSKGIGSKLLKHLESSLYEKKVTDIYLITEHKYPAAGFYQNRGFENNEDTGIYMKKVNNPQNNHRSFPR